MPGRRKSSLVQKKKGGHRSATEKQQAHNETETGTTDSVQPAEPLAQQSISKKGKHSERSH